MNPGETSESPLDVSHLYEGVDAALATFSNASTQFWVRGEVAKVYEKSHVYLDIVDSGSSVRDTRRAVLNAHCWMPKWGQLKRRLADEGVTLRPGVVITFRGYTDLYPPSGRLGFTITEINANEEVGDIAKRRAELVARLDAEGLLARNKHAVLSPVPLRVGLIASKGTEGFADFTGQLLHSGLSFSILHVQSAVQGDNAPGEILRALATLDVSDVDVICIVRGGGSKGDLQCFDDEAVARAIADATHPVFTGIGHTGDTSVADLVAHTAEITPTKLGEALVTMVAGWRQRVVVCNAASISDHAEALVEAAGATLREAKRSLMFCVRDRLRSEHASLRGALQRMELQGTHVLSQAARDLQTKRQLLDAYNPQRRLEQGWALVRDQEGRVVTSITTVTADQRLVVQLSDGKIETQVRSIEESV